MNDPDAARALFEIGAAGLLLAGLIHAPLALFDDVRRPRFFTPLDDQVRGAMGTTGIRFRGLFPAGDVTQPSIWRAWLGFNISHGVGLIALGLVCLLLAIDDFEFVRDSGFLMPLALVASAVYLGLALRYWFWGPILLLGSTTACFGVALVLA